MGVYFEQRRDKKQEACCKEDRQSFAKTVPEQTHSSSKLLKKILKRGGGLNDLAYCVFAI